MPWLNCKICNKKFYAKPRHIKIGWGKYCSDKCKFEGQKRGKIVKCDNCGNTLYRTPKDFSRSKNGLFFCSRSCHASWRNKNIRVGKSHPNWLTGVSTYRRLLLKNAKEIKCENCYFLDERVLVVHHKDGNRQNNELSNLELLCRNCHYIKHEFIC